MASLTIGSTQLETLRATSSHRFVLRVVDFLRRHLPGEIRVIPGESLLNEVEKQIARARKIGLASEADLASFVVFRFLIGSNSDLQAPFISIWVDAGADGPTKVARTRVLLLAHERHKRG